MLYLASQSPRRREILQQIGVQFEVLAVAVPEHWDGQESAYDYVIRVALAKARAGRALAGGQPVLAADTEVQLNNVILGKPADKAAAMIMLQQLSGRSHQVLTAVALAHYAETVIVNTSVVSFRTLSHDECEAYCESGEPYDKAGAYAIQGRAAAFVTRLQGSFSGVMGLPRFDTTQLLQQLSKPR